MRNLQDCKKCGKPRDYVIKSGKRAGKYQTYCRACLSAQVAAWQRKNPERNRERQRNYWNNNPHKKLRAKLSRYGVDERWYWNQLAVQGDACAICRKKETWKVPSQSGDIFSLSVDHHHATGTVRGLLCNNCNHKLATLEAHEWLALAMAYLDKYAQP